MATPPRPGPGEDHKRRYPESPAASPRCLFGPDPPCTPVRQRVFDRNPLCSPKSFDRFIPARGSFLTSGLDQVEEASTSGAGESDAYGALLRDALGCSNRSPQPNTIRSPITSSRRRNILQFAATTPNNRGIPTSPAISPALDESFASVVRPASKTSTRPKIASAPFKVLDAPGLGDDFYLNLIDWSAQNVLAVSLGSKVYLWDGGSSEVSALCDVADAGNSVSVCSVSWTQRGTYLAVGLSNGHVQVWDAAARKLLRTMEGHRARVGAMSWASHLLSTGSRDKSILHRDVRAAQPLCSQSLGHRAEVCGLKWSPDERELASGGNDNLACVWSVRGATPQAVLRQHKAAVKALAWSPHQHGLLATGGGTADQTIRFWNTVSGAALSHVDTGSQVSNLAWSREANELVSTHGYSQNAVAVWRYPAMTRLATLSGHTQRVLYLAASPDGQAVVTGAGDETLRFWNVFPGAKAKGSVNELATPGSRLRTQIR